MIFGRLDRYVLRAVLIPLWFVVAVAVMLLVLDQMLRLFNFILRENAQVDIVWRMLATLLPEYLSLALPIGFFIAVMLAVRRFALSSELDVIKSAGMSFFRLSRIVYVLAFGLMAFNFALVAYVQPFTAYEYSKLRFQVRSTALTANVRPGEFVEMTDQITLRVGATTAGARPFKDVFLERCDEFKNCEVITAREAVFAQTRDVQSELLVLRLFDGHQIRVTAGGPQESAIAFEAWDLIIEAPQAENFRHRGGLKQEATFNELLRVVNNPTSSDPSDYRLYLSSLHWRILHTLLFLALPLLGIALGAVDKRRDRGIGLVLGVAAVIFYYELLQAGEARVAAGVAEPWLAMWPLFFGFLAGSAALFWAVARRPGLVATAPIEAQIDRILLGWATWREKLRKARRARTGASAAQAPPAPFVLGRHLAGLFVGRFALMLVLLVVVLQVLDVLNKSNQLLSAPNAQDDAIWQYVLLRAPQLITQFAPFAALLAVLITLAELANSSEITAMRAGGLSAGQVLRPVGLTCALIAGCHFLFQEAVMVPRSAQLSFWESNGYSNFAAPEPENLRNRLWLADGRMVLKAATAERGAAQTALNDALVFERDEATGRVFRVRQADQAIYRDGLWNLRDVADFDVGTATVARAEEAPWITTLTPERLFMRTIKADETRMGELWNVINVFRGEGGFTGGLETTFLNRFAGPAATLAMPLLGALAGFGLQRQGGLLRRLGIGAGLGFAYFVVENLMVAIGGLGAAAPLLAAFLPLILFMLIGFAMLLAVDR